MIRFLLSVSLVGLSTCVPTLSAAAVPPTRAVTRADEDEALAALKKAFKNVESLDVAQCIEAIRGLSIFDTEKVAKALVRAHSKLEERILAATLTRSELILERAELQKGKEFEKNPTYPTPIYERLGVIRETLPRLRDEIDGLRTVQSELRLRISATRDERASSWLLQKVLGSKKHSIPLKLAVSRIAEDLDEDLVADLERLLGRAKRPAEILALLEGLSIAGKRAREVGPRVLKLLGHKQEAVRARAAQTLARLAVAEAIEPMIDLLEQESGRTQQVVARSLAELTRQNHGVLVMAWRRWWADEKENILGGSVDLGGGMFDRTQRVVDGGYYFDIAMDGKSIMYIIDSSGSMKEPIVLSTGDNPEGSEKSRLEACKAELIGSLGRLEKDVEFNVIWYNDAIHLLEPQMMFATPDNVKRAQEWVAKLQPLSSTNIYDSLQTAFDVAGQGSKDKYYDVALDTIFLLTDGAPTLPDSKPDSTDKILEAVRDWNALGRVTVHTIGIGRGINEGFLRTLAEENNGEFRSY